MDDFTSLDTHVGPGGVKVVEWNQNQLIRSLWRVAAVADTTNSRPIQLYSTFVLHKYAVNADWGAETYLESKSHIPKIRKKNSILLLDGYYKQKTTIKANLHNWM